MIRHMFLFTCIVALLFYIRMQLSDMKRKTHKESIFTAMLDILLSILTGFNTETTRFLLSLVLLVICILALINGWGG